MSRRRTVAAAGAVGVVLLLGGCAVGGPDDEMARPSASRTTTLPPDPRDSATRIPVGAAGLTPGSPVTVQGSVISVDGRRADLAPLQVDGYAVAPGGVYFRNADELWFTDLTSARSSGFTDVTGLRVSADGSILSVRVGRGSGAGAWQHFDTTTGKPVLPAR